MGIRQYFFLLGIFLPLTGISQHFTGKVVDRESGEGIPFADVYFVELQTGTSTDINGDFVLDDLLKNKIHMRISYIGFNTLNEEVDLNEVHEKTFYMDPSHIELEEVVFSVPGGKLAGENVVNIDRQSLSSIDQSSVSLAEAISSIPGVDQNTTGTGIGKPVIRGLSGNRIVTYAQNIRVENQQWGAEHGLGVAELGLESIEVIKGPASLLYGSDALGGVLFFVEERYARHNHFEADFGTKFLSNSLGSYNNVGLKVHKNEFKMNLFGGYISNADYKIPGGERVYNSRFNEKSFKTAIGYNTGNWVSNTYYSYLGNDFGIVDEANYSNSKSRTPQLPFQKISNHALSLDNSYYFKKSHVNLILGYTANNRKEFEDETNTASLDMELQSFTYNLKWYSAQIGSHLNLIAGAQGMHLANENRGEELLIPDATTDDVGLFVIGDYDINNFKIQAGLRGDRRHIETENYSAGETQFDALNKSYKNLNYSVGGVLSKGKNVYRMNFASGFRAPNTYELLSDGIHEGTQWYEIGNPDLQSENALQIDFTYEFNSEHFTFNINPFINFINDYIYLSPQDSIIDDVPVYAYLQDNALLYGGETGFHYHPHKLHWLHIESNLSTVIAQDSEGNPLPLIPATRIITTLKAEFSSEAKVQFKDIVLQGLNKFDQNRTGEFETPTPSYFLVNLGTNVNINTGGKPIRLSAGINNLFNVKYIDNLSRLKPMDIPNPGINFYIGIKFGFEKTL